jgi:hypothetical protein
MAQGIDCRECRLAHWEADTDPPCDQPQEDRETGELVHRCKYGLVDLLPENWPTWNAYRYLRVMGPEAGMQLLRAAIGERELAEIAEELVLLQGAQNRRDRQRHDHEVHQAKGSRGR